MAKFDKKSTTIFAYCIISIFILCSCTPNVNSTLPSTLPENATITATATKEIISTPTMNNVDLERVKGLRSLLYDFIEDSRYDPNKSVLHLYLDTMDISLVDNILILTVDQVRTPEEYESLVNELFPLAIFYSKYGSKENWGLERIELFNPGRDGSYVRIFIDGKENIEKLSEGKIGIDDFVQFDVSLPK